MRKIRLIAFGIIVFLPLSSLATPNMSVKSERELRDECSYEITGVIECLQDKLKTSEADLKLAEEDARKSIIRWDEDPQYIKSAEVKLAAAGKVFAKYREEQCTFAASLGGGAIGNALNMRRFACMAELNSRRAEQLRNAIIDLPTK